MHFIHSRFAPALLAIAMAGPVWADTDELEITMEVMDSFDDLRANELTLDVVEEDEPDSRWGFLGPSRKTSRTREPTASSSSGVVARRSSRAVSRR